MAIAVATVSAVATASGTSVTIDKPTGLAVGDLLVAHLFAYGNDSTPSNNFTVPAGWTRDADAAPGWFRSASSEGSKMNMMYKVADSSDVAASNFSFTFGASRTLRGVLFRITGQNPTPLGDANSAGSANDALSTSPATYAAGVTPTVADSLILILIGTKGGSSVTSYAIATSDPGSWTEAYDSNDVAAAYVNRTQITATGDVTFSWSGGNVGNLVIVAAFSPSFGVTVSPSVITSAGTVLSPTVTGGALVSPSTITATGTVHEPESGQADWSTKGKSAGGSWSNTNKS